MFQLIKEKLVGCIASNLKQSLLGCSTMILVLKKLTLKKYHDFLRFLTKLSQRNDASMSKFRDWVSFFGNRYNLLTKFPVPRNADRQDGSYLA